MKRWPGLAVALLLMACSTWPGRKPVATGEPPPDTLAIADLPETETTPFIEEGERFVQQVNESQIQALLQEQRNLLEAEFALFNLESTLDREEVLRWIEFYRGPGRAKLERFYRRGLRYLPYIFEIVEEEGLPRDLAYLPMIESGYNPRARSRAGAVGIWQFMRGTARKYGLRVDWWMDERRDPIRSTRAAMHYLRDLYEEFGSWDLALAAYNVGEGRIRKLREDSTQSFWEVRRRLPRETRLYVPSFFAVVLILKDPEAFGVTLDTTGVEPWVFDSVYVPAPVELTLVARWAGTTVEVLEDLNPAFRRWATPPDLKGFYLRIPPGTRERVLAGMEQTPRSRWVSKLVHRVRRGESLWTIARRYGVSVSAIARANHLRRRSLIHPGQLLWIPVPGGASERFAARTPEPAPPSRTATYYRVRRGDSLWKIARRFGVTVADLKRWNHLKSNTLRPGQRLRVSPPDTGTFAAGSGTRYYRVRRGDSLWKIARRFGVTVADLKRWNHLKSSTLRPGQRLVIRASRQASARSFITYRVRRGDTLDAIARRYGVRVRDLMEINGIQNPRRLRPGQRLRVPTSG